MSDIETTFWSHFDTSQVQVFGINRGESLTTAINFARNFGLTYPVLHDPQGIVYNQYIMSGISPFPKDVIVNQNGVVAYMHTEYDPQYMLQTINSLLITNGVSMKGPNLSPKDLELKVYPNPFNSIITVSFKVIDKSPVRLEIYNILGQKIQTQELKNYAVDSRALVRLDLSKNPTGLYFLTITNGGQSKSYKLLLMK